MKAIKQLCALLVVLGTFSSCVEEETSYALQELSAPTKVSATFDIASDDSGMVSATPTAEGATEFQVYFGDAEGEAATAVPAGETVTHTYGEGTFTMRIVAIGATGLTSELNRVVTISFAAPSNLAVATEISATDPLELTVTPTATNATVFDVYFGEAADEAPTTIMAGKPTVHKYAAAGDYTVRVVARGAGAATVETSTTVTISGATDPVVLPVTFESATVNYAFESFGDASAAVVDNPDTAGNNMSSKVGQFTKPAGAQVWAGTFLTLQNPLDVGTNKIFKVNIFSPKSGITVKMKLENLTDGAIAHEVDVVNTVANDWEELTFDFAAIDTANEYQKVVLFFDFGNDGDGTMYLFDDIDQPSAMGGNCSAETEENIDPAMGDINWTFMTNDAAHAFEGFGNIASGIVENPNRSGINMSCNVQSYIKTAGCETWSGAGKAIANAIDLTTAANKQFSMLVYGETKTTEVTLRLEFEPFPNTDPSVDIVQTMTKIGEWEELTFDFSAHSDKTFKSIIVYFDRNQPCDDAVYYFDDIKQITVGGGTAAMDPTAAPDAPTANAANVFSVFSDEYTDPAGVNYFPNWGQTTTYEQIDLNGNAVIKYADFNYEGIEIGEAVDVTGYTMVHIDVWSNDYTALPFFLISQGSGEQSVSLTLVPNQWNSIDIPLSDFTGQGLSVDDIFQFKFDVQPNNGGTVFIDNLFFYN